MWGEVDRTGGWMDQLISLWKKAQSKPKIARTFGFDEVAVGPSLHSGPQENREAGASAIGDFFRRGI